MNYDYTINLIDRQISRTVDYIKWLRRELRKKMPYKCYKQSDVAPKKRRFRKDIGTEKQVLKELRTAIKILKSQP